MTDIDHLAEAKKLAAETFSTGQAAQVHALISIAESLREIAFPTPAQTPVEPEPAEPEPITAPRLGESERGYEWIDRDGDHWRWLDGLGWRWRDNEGDWHGYRRMMVDRSCGPYTRGARVEPVAEPTELDHLPTGLDGTWIDNNGDHWQWSDERGEWIDPRDGDLWSDYFAAPDRTSGPYRRLAE